MEAQITSSSLKALYQIAAARKKHTSSGIDQRVTDPAEEVTFSAAGRSKGQEIGAAIEPFVPLG